MLADFTRHMSSRSTRGVAGVGTSFLFINDLESIVWMDPTLFIPSSIDGMKPHPLATGDSQGF